MSKRDLVVVGGSTGSSEVLKPFVEALPPDYAGSVFVTVHMPADGALALGAMLERLAKLPVGYPTDGEPIAPGRVYLAAPDRHLMLVDGVVRYGFGPRENMMRPAIDPLFRSAAAAYGPRVVGVILSGMLNDGAAGLEAVARCGGLTVVQEPETAVAPDMPRAACRVVTPDYLAPPARLAGLVAALARQDATGPPCEVSEALRLEVEIALGRRLGSERLQRLGNPAALTCPECLGVLSHMRDSKPMRFRCQTGHGFTTEILEANDTERVEEALRIALRLVEERVELTGRMAQDARNHGRKAVSLYDGRTREYGGYAETLRAAAVALMRRAEEPKDD